MATRTPAENTEILEALRAAVAAKLAYWEANRKLEVLVHGADISDEQAHHLEDVISELAADAPIPFHPDCIDMATARTLLAPD